MPKEIWKAIEGYPGYEVSNWGRVKSFKYKKPKFLKTDYKTNRYSIVKLMDGVEVKNLLVHRIVAGKFCKKRPGCDQVNHLDGNRNNNFFKNLEWCTQSENMLHCYKTKLRKAPYTWLGRTGKNHCSSKPIVQIDDSGNVVKKFDTIKDAKIEIGWSVGKALRKNKPYKGFRFEYV